MIGCVISGQSVKNVKIGKNVKWLNTFTSSWAILSGICVYVCLSVSAVQPKRHDQLNTDEILYRVSLISMPNLFTLIWEICITRWRHGGHFVLFRYDTLMVAMLLRLSSKFLSTRYKVVFRGLLLKISKIGW